MLSWYQHVSTKTAPILDKIKHQSFVQKLMDGSLPKDTFTFYIEQDALYLAEYKKTLATLGTRCNDIHDTQFYLQSATGILEVETALHQMFVDKEVSNIEPSPTCELYNSYLARVATFERLEVGLAAVLPCFTIYKEVGDHILANQTNSDTNPYQDWISTYGGEAFAQSVAQAVEITNRHASQASDEVRQKMEAAFEKASKLEWMFWDSAYNREQWKL